MADWVILEILASWINWLFRLVKWEILPVLPSWELSGEGILANTDTVLVWYETSIRVAVHGHD